MQVKTAGLDPTVGILHQQVSRQQAIVYDLMEPRKPLFDHTVLKFVQSRTFQPADFTIRADGVCRLDPEKTRNVVR